MRNLRNIKVNCNYVYFLGTKEHELFTYVLVFPMKSNEKNKHHKRFNLAEFISESQTTLSIEQHLRYVFAMIKSVVPPTMQLLHEVVVDWSWAEINAVVLAFNNMSVKVYLQLTFEIIVEEKAEKLKDIVILRECSSHLTKTMRGIGKKYFPEYETRSVVYQLLGAIFNCKTLIELLKVVKSFIRIFKYPLYDYQVKDDLKLISDFKIDETINHEEENEIVSQEDEFFEKEDFKQIFKDSPFFQVTYNSCFCE